jgi:Flp pilus assembly pilin Flp
MIRELWTEEDGMATVEYALIMMLLVVATAAAWTTLGMRTADSAQSSSVRLRLLH